MIRLCGTQQCVRYIALVLLALPAFGFAHLGSNTAAAFDRYAALTESQPHADLPAEEKAKLREGAEIIQPGNTLDNGKEIRVPGGLLQDWIGKMFMPGATIARVKAVLQDYPNYKNYYKPEVIESKQLAHTDDEYDAFLRLYKHQILTVVLNTTYHVRYITPDARHLVVISRSTRIAEVRNAKPPYTAEEPVGNDTGFLWRLNSYWHFEEADGGVYAECRALSLSRDVPLGLGFMLKGFLQKFPKESMINTLRGTRDAVKSKS